MSITVLVVDDDAELREFLTILLATEGYAVFSASDEEQALSLFSANSIDLIMLDLVMPKVNGIALLKKFRQVNPDFKCIIFSAALQHEILSQNRNYLEELVDKIVAKPASSRELLEGIAQVLGLPEAV